jgi:hypothetical protein
MRMLRHLSAVLLLGSALTAASACDGRRGSEEASTRIESGSPDTASTEMLEEAKDLALVRVINAIPGSAGITIYAGDSAAFTAVQYRGKTEFHAIPDEMLNFKLGSRDKPLAENRENLSEGGYYTMVAMPDEGGADKRNLRVLDDDRKTIPVDKARVRIVNAIPGDLEISVFMQGREEPLFEGVDFKAEAGWSEVDPVAGTLEIRQEGKSAALAIQPDVKLEAGKSYTFVVAGRAPKPDLIRIEDGIPRM